jgi:hypothetical protein
MIVNLSFLDPSRYLFFPVAPHLPHDDECSPFQTHCYSENLVAPEIELGASGSVARNCEH